MQIDPSYSVAHFNLAIQYEHDARYSLAQRHYHAASQLSPGDPKPLFNLANLTRDHLKQPDTALQLYQQVLARDAQHVQAWVNLAALHVQCEARDEAYRCLAKAVAVPLTADTQPHISLALHNLFVLQHISDPQAAAHTLERYLELNPTDEAMRARLPSLHSSSSA